MALTINTNLPAMITQKNLQSATTSLSAAIERMTTGYKINHAKDNAAGYSIAANWKTMLGSIDIASQNAAMGLDLLTTAEENYALITTHLQRVRDLTEQAANGTYGVDSLVAIKAEIKSRLMEINRVAVNAEYNGIDLMSKDTPSSVRLQVGLYQDNNSAILLAADLFKNANISVLLTVEGVSTKSAENYAMKFAGLKKVGDEIKIDTDNNPSKFIEAIDTAISTIAGRVTQIGAFQNSVESAMSALTVQSENITSSLSTIRDADVAIESSNYIKAQILQQASATLLAAANQTPSIALNLV